MSKRFIKPSQKELDEFLTESNAIEDEYSKEAFEDAKQAWIMGALNFKDFDISYILGIHRRLLKRLAPNYAGVIRTSPVYIGGEKRDQSKEEIILQLNELIDMWNKNKEILKSKEKRKQDREEFIKRWHILFELCHANYDGNGRTGRILMNLQRLYLGLPLMIIHTGVEQENYYTWFHRKRDYIWNYQKENIIKDYNNGKGKSVGQIADELNFNHQAVSNLLKRNGIKVIIQYNNAPKGSKNGNWKGGIRHVNNVPQVYIPGHNLARGDGWVPIHRLKMQEKLGRNLLPEEVVHHKDENEENINIDNLQLFPNNGEHRKEHARYQKRDTNGKWFKDKEK